MTRQYWANLALCIVLGGLAIFSFTRAGSALTAKGLFVSEPEPSREAAALLKDVVLTRYHVGEGLNKMVEADFYVQNNSQHNVKNIEVLCEFFDKNGKNGKYLDRKIWKLMETVPAKHQAKISSVSRRFVNTQARSLRCSVTDFQLVKKPFFSLERREEEAHGESSTTGHGESAPVEH